LKINCPAARKSQPSRDIGFFRDFQVFPEEQKRRLTFGVELEIEPSDELIPRFSRYCKGDFIEANHRRKELWQAINKVSEPFLLATTDCTLRLDGLEIVSNPATYLFHKKFPWDEVMEIIDFHQWESTIGCGLHIHVGKSNMNYLSAIKWGTFININWDKWEKVGRRHFNKHGGAGSGPKNWRANVREKRRCIRNKFVPNRHQDGTGRRSIAFRNNTIEVRFPRSTLDRDILIATIGSLKSSYEWCSMHGFAHIIHKDAFFEYREWAINQYGITEKVLNLVNRNTK